MAAGATVEETLQHDALGQVSHVAQWTPSCTGTEDPEGLLAHLGQCSRHEA